MATEVENAAAMDAFENGRLCIITVVDRLQKSGMSEYFPDTLEKSGYSHCRHDENCAFRNYSEVEALVLTLYGPDYISQQQLKKRQDDIDREVRKLKRRIKDLQKERLSLSGSGQ